MFPVICVVLLPRSFVIVYMYSPRVCGFTGVGFEGSNVKNGSHELQMIKQKGKVVRLQEEIERKFYVNIWLFQRFDLCFPIM